MSSLQNNTKKPVQGRVCRLATDKGQALTFQMRNYYSHLVSLYEDDNSYLLQKFLCFRILGPLLLETMAFFQFHKSCTDVTRMRPYWAGNMYMICSQRAHDTYSLCTMFSLSLLILGIVGGFGYSVSELHVFHALFPKDVSYIPPISTAQGIHGTQRLVRRTVHHHGYILRHTTFPGQFKAVFCA